MNDIRYQSNGAYWQIVYRDINGRRVVKSAGAKAKVSESAANRKCVKLAALFANTPSASVAGKSPPLSAWQGRYFALRERELAEGTLALHRDTFTRLREHFGDPRLSKLTAAGCQGWVAWLRAEARSRRKPLKGEQPGPLARSTVSRHVRDAHVIFEYARRLGLVQVNPFADIGGVTSTATPWEHIDREHFRAVLQECPCDGYRRLMALCRYAGLRLGEALRLTWADVDMPGRFLRVVPPGDMTETTKHRLRWVPIDSDLAEILSATPGGSEDFVVEVSHNNLHRKATAIVKRAGLPAYAKPYHTLRKCLISEWLSQGIPVTDVAQWMGHSVAVLEKHYARWLSSSAQRVTGQRNELDELRRENAKLRAMIGSENNLENYSGAS